MTVEVKKEKNLTWTRFFVTLPFALIEALLRKIKKPPSGFFTSMLYDLARVICWPQSLIREYSSLDAQILTRTLNVVAFAFLFMFVFGPFVIMPLAAVLGVGLGFVPAGLGFGFPIYKSIVISFSTTQVFMGLVGVVASYFFQRANNGELDDIKPKVGTKPLSLEDQEEAEIITQQWGKKPDKDNYIHTAVGLTASGRVKGGYGESDADSDLESSKPSHHVSVKLEKGSLAALRKPKADSKEQYPLLSRQPLHNKTEANYVSSLVKRYASVYAGAPTYGLSSTDKTALFDLLTNLHSKKNIGITYLEIRDFLVSCQEKIEKQVVKEWVKQNIVEIDKILPAWEKSVRQHEERSDLLKGRCSLEQVDFSKVPQTQKHDQGSAIGSVIPHNQSRGQHLKVVSKNALAAERQPSAVIHSK